MKKLCGMKNFKLRTIPGESRNMVFCGWMEKRSAREGYVNYIVNIKFRNLKRFKLLYSKNKKKCLIKLIWYCELFFQISFTKWVEWIENYQELLSSIKWNISWSHALVRILVIIYTVWLQLIGHKQASIKFLIQFLVVTCGQCIFWWGLKIKSNVSVKRGEILIVESGPRLLRT